MRKTKNEQLPGMLLSRSNIFELKGGEDRVLDRNSGKTGTLYIRETAAEVINVFIKFDGSDEEVPAWHYPECVLIY
jgi:hypothetical protein